jgi:hypothetical protein
VPAGVEMVWWAWLCLIEAAALEIGAAPRGGTAVEGVAPVTISSPVRAPSRVMCCCIDPFGVCIFREYGIRGRRGGGGGGGEVQMGRGRCGHCEHSTFRRYSSTAHAAVRTGYVWMDG